MPEITLTVNGQAHRLVVEPRMLLVDVLRHRLRLTGTHVGCEHGVCGACTVNVNGRTARACLLFAAQLDGAAIVTVEGLSEGPLQQSFHAHHALQCGYCTPGFLMVLTEFLAETPDPSDAEILEVLAGNLCRCTGYINMVPAVREAAAALRSYGS